MSKDSPPNDSTPGEPNPDAPTEGGPPTSRPPSVPQWLVGIVLILGVAAIFAGLNDPVWFVIGFPCILVLIVWVWVRIAGPG
jgi:hypothetical protein